RTAPSGGALAGKPSTASREKVTVMPVEENSAFAGAPVPMRCSACGHVFNAAAADVTRHFTSGLAKLYSGDIDKTLDNAQKGGGVGYPCPKCGKNAAMPSAAGGFLDAVGAPGPAQ
ncbi:MAG TPA: hypothetical protein P5137_09940, partial [Candidatus Brocadiia bacterium]|nr:hypothetical protein [Candidatus Brocadiia bacterium]